MRRTLALVLAALMLLPAMIACNKDTNPPDGTDAPAETTAPAETLDPNDRKNAKDDLPEDFNMNGETVGVLTRHTYRKIDWDGADAKDSEVLAQAVYNRTEAVQDRLGLTFELTDMDLGYGDYGFAISENVMAGDDTWQIILTAGNASIRLGNDHLFSDVSKNQYLDFDQPWWASTVMEKMSVDGSSVRFMMGDVTMNTYYWAYVAFFNKRIYEDNFGDPEDLYAKAINNDWFYDDVIEMAEAAANDVNGDGVMDEGDTFGFMVSNAWQFAYMQDASGFETYVRDEKGYPVLQHDLDRGMECLAKIYKLCYETPGAGADTAMHAKYPSNGGSVFSDCNLLFDFNTLASTDFDYMRNMEDDYGILPMPRIDEKQESYVSPITTSATFITIPKTCVDDRIGGVIEALSSESYRSVVEVFYESALKTKYSRDSSSGKCIDIVKDTLFKDFFSEYYGRVGDSYFFRAMLNEHSSNYVSRYNSVVRVMNGSIQAVVDAIVKASEE